MSDFIGAVVIVIAPIKIGGPIVPWDAVFVAGKRLVVGRQAVKGHTD
jgi:hypothetical protein